MVALYLFIVIALPMALGIYVTIQGLHRSRRCPTCAGETLRLRSSTHRILGTLLPSTELHLRWCMACGWQGAARLRRAAPLDRRAAPAPDRTAERVDIRQLEIDGQPWKVMIQCWAERDRWLGRLMFIGPNGQSHIEERSSLEGGSALEVLSGALSIPEQALAGRIRRAIH
jgi:hypothetical protein